METSLVVNRDTMSIERLSFEAFECLFSSFHYLRTISVDDHLDTFSDGAYISVSQKSGKALIHGNAVRGFSISQ